MEVNSDLIARLKLIGLLNKGDKIDTKYMVVQPCGIITKIARSLGKDDRYDTLEFLNITIQKSFELLTSQLDVKKDKNALCNMFAINIVKDLKKSIDGINHLKDTYDNDKLFICKLDFLSEEVQVKIQDFIAQNKKIFNDSLIAEIEQEVRDAEAVKKEELKNDKEDVMSTPALKPNGVLTSRAISPVGIVREAVIQTRESVKKNPRNNTD